MNSSRQSSSSPIGGLQEECQRNKPLAEFFRFLVLCHAVMVDRDPKTEEILYQSSSPDELALVSFIIF